MRYRVRFTERAARDLEEIHEFVGADSAEYAAAWFARLTDVIDSLEIYPQRGAVAPEDRKLRQLLFGTKPHVYRIIYEVDRRYGVVHVVHLRHGARSPFSAFDDV